MHSILFFCHHLVVCLRYFPPGNNAKSLHTLGVFFIFWDVMVWHYELQHIQPHDLIESYILFTFQGLKKNLWWTAKCEMWQPLSKFWVWFRIRKEFWFGLLAVSLLAFADSSWLLTISSWALFSCLLINFCLCICNVCDTFIFSLSMLVFFVIPFKTEILTLWLNFAFMMNPN